MLLKGAFFYLASVFGEAMEEGGGVRQSNMVASIKARSNPERFRATFLLTLPLSWSLCCSHAFKGGVLLPCSYIGGGGGGGVGGVHQLIMVTSIKAKPNPEHFRVTYLLTLPLSWNLCCNHAFKMAFFRLAPILGETGGGGGSVGGRQYQGYG